MPLNMSIIHWCSMMMETMTIKRGARRSVTRKMNGLMPRGDSDWNHMSEIMPVLALLRLRKRVCVEGVIGYDFFANFTLVVDRVGGEMTFVKN